MLNLFRKIIPSIGFAGVLILGFALRAGADVTIELDGVNGASTNGVYVDPYFGTVNNGPEMPLYCDDFVDHIGVSESWTAGMTSYTTLAGEAPSGPWTVLYDTPVGGSAPNASDTVLQNYEAAGYLVEKSAEVVPAAYYGGPVPTGMAAQAYEDYSMALWAIFDPALYSSLDAGALADYANAFTQVSSNNLLLTELESDGLEIYTPTSWNSDDRPQEFIGWQTPSETTTVTTVTPEPSSLVLIGLGMFMVVGVIRRRTTGAEKGPSV
jgi:PEP-CTERM motif